MIYKKKHMILKTIYMLAFEQMIWAIEKTQILLDHVL